MEEREAEYGGRVRRERYKQVRKKLIEQVS